MADVTDLRYHLPSARYRARSRTEAIIIHHTETRAAATVEGIRRGHLARGWIDIGYNRLIRQGARLQGRPTWAQGSHAPGWNSRSVGVALVGSYLTDSPPDWQLDALLQELTALREQYPTATILGHRDAMEAVGRPGYTDCPGGDWLHPWLERLAVAGLLT